MKPLSSKRFWFYNDWDVDPREGDQSLWKWLKLSFTGSDEYGHHTVVLPLGKSRAIVVVYRAGYKGFKKCFFCQEARDQTLKFEQDSLYVQTYWNIDEYEEVYDLEDEQWNEALGVGV